MTTVGNAQGESSLFFIQTFLSFFHKFAVRRQVAWVRLRNGNYSIVVLSFYMAHGHIKLHAAYPHPINGMYQCCIAFEVVS